MRYGSPLVLLGPRSRSVTGPREPGVLTILASLMAALLARGCKESVSPPSAIGVTAVSVTAVTPASGPLAGGTSVTITGTNFIDVTSVTIGGSELGSRTVVSPTQITGTTPAATSTGAKDIVVTSSSHGSGTCSGCFTVFVLEVRPSTIATVVGGSVFFDVVSSEYIGCGPVTWTSANPTVATARDSLQFSGCPPRGFVRGVSSGSATITATTPFGPATSTISMAQVMFASVSAGATHACGVTSNGKAFCWGEGEASQLGAPINADYDWCLVYGYANIACTASPVGVTGMPTFTTVATSRDVFDFGGSSCGLTASGTAYCWGSNFFGQLGNGTTGDDISTNIVVVPTPVSGGLAFTAIGIGRSHACGVTTTRVAYCWGDNQFGQLGTGDRVSQTIPTTVAEVLTLAAIGTGTEHTCGLTTVGTAYCWGENDVGQLGTGDTVSRTTPSPVTGGLTFTAISTGTYHTCGLTAAGTAYCWGGDLGYIVTMTSPTAVAGGLTFGAISAGGLHTCGLTTSGVAYCWGDLLSGTRDSIPVPVVGGLRFATITAGFDYTCGLTIGGAAYCWGDNYWGQLGNGTHEFTSTPTKVLGQP